MERRNLSQFAQIGNFSERGTKDEIGKQNETICLDCTTRRVAVKWENPREET